MPAAAVPNLVLHAGRYEASLAAPANLPPAPPALPMRISRPAAVSPNDPVASTMSPGRAPPRPGRCRRRRRPCCPPDAPPGPAPARHTVIDSSSPCPVSPPANENPNSPAASARPDATADAYLAEAPGGSDTDASPETGAAPFAARSLTHAATLLRAALRGPIPGSMSVPADIVSTHQHVARAGRASTSSGSPRMPRRPRNIPTKSASSGIPCTPPPRPRRPLAAAARPPRGCPPRPTP